jgi:hypothetical protein
MDHDVIFPVLGLLAFAAGFVAAENLGDVGEFIDSVGQKTVFARLSLRVLGPRLGAAN